MENVKGDNVFYNENRRKKFHYILIKPTLSEKRKIKQLKSIKNERYSGLP